MTADAGIADWIEAEYRIAAEHMLRCISATAVAHHRPALGQFIRPARGSVVASLEPGSYAREPDYFFHWFRDAALVMGALSQLSQAGEVEDGPTIIADFIRFEAAYLSFGIARPQPPRSRERQLYTRRGPTLIVLDRNPVPARWRTPVNSSKSTTIVLSPESRFFGPGRGREKAVSPRARIATELPTSNAVNVPLNMPACAEQSNRQRCSSAHQIRKEQPNHIGSDDHRMICHEHGEWAGQDADRIGQDMRCCCVHLVGLGT